MKPIVKGLLTAGLCLSLLGMADAQSGELPAAQLAAIKQKLAQRVPDLPPIESARTTPVSGLVELRAGSHVFYADATGDHLIEGHMIETRTQRNLTEERLDEINRVDVAALPTKDAIVWKAGTGKRRLVVFSDPNCGYCKQLEREIQKLKDVTVHTYLIGILGEDSRVKVDNIWCARDRTQTWLDWMLQGNTPPKAMGLCGSPGQRNLALAQKLRVNGTPAIFFDDGSRLPGAANAATLEQRLAKASSKAGS
ncbi:MAG: DsbC family protein [Proteobacteria bacterium]|uniref:DsbC family protein n=1 Tax=Aquabacterium sp. TaxID=1872578 RepID=UPI0035C7522E|nr:DsbC family protein [Pseudomonadota bacterium]